MTEDKILWTAQYVEGDLSDTERVEFERLLTKDAILQQHLVDYYHIHNSLKMKLAEDDGRNVLVDTLKVLNRAHFATPVEKPKVIKLNTYLKWVSSVAAILVVGLFIWAPWQGNLYEQYHKQSQMAVAERGAEKTDLDVAAGLFNEKKYNDAKPILAKLNTADSQNAMVAYYYSVSLLETNEIAKSRTLLEVLFNGESVYRYDAAYVLAMSYLKEEKVEDAKFWLEKIPSGATQFKQAQTLLNKL